MEGGPPGGFLHRANQHDGHVHENSEGSFSGGGNQRGYFGARWRRLLLERNGDECKEGKQRSERNVPVHARCARKNPGDASRDYRHADSWPGGGNHRPDGTGRGSDRKWPAGADYRSRRHLPALYGAARTRPAHHRHHRRESPWRHEPTEGNDRCAKVKVSNVGRFSVTQERRRRRDFALVAKSGDNGLVGRAAAQRDREEVRQLFVDWTAERVFPRGAEG